MVVGELFFSITQKYPCKRRLRESVYLNGTCRREGILFFFFHTSSVTVYGSFTQMLNIEKEEFNLKKKVFGKKWRVSDMSCVYKVMRLWLSTYMYVNRDNYLFTTYPFRRHLPVGRNENSKSMKNILFTNGNDTWRPKGRGKQASASLDQDLI